MTRQRETRFWSVWILVLGGALAEVLVGAMFLPSRVLAQITPDETLGGERSQVTHDVEVRGSRADRIDGGARRGANLFHSFREFNVHDKQRVYFANPSGVENILGRVTGNDVSDIMGTLGVDGGANLFLINPNGIIFGENARLNISGSFFASTGSRFTFSDGSEFSVTNPQAPPLLAMSAPIGVQYGAISTGAVTNAGYLTVGGDLTLSGGTVTSTGTLASERPRNDGGNITLIASGDINISGYITSSSRNGNSGDIQLNAGGDIHITTVSSTEDPEIYQGILSETENGNSGRVQISAGRDLIIVGGISKDTRLGIGSATDNGNSGSIRLSSGRDLTITGTGSALDSLTALIATATNRGNSGDLLIVADRNIHIRGITDSRSNGVTSGVALGTAPDMLSPNAIDSGDIRIMSRNGEVNLEGSLLFSFGGTTGKAGSIEILAPSSITTNSVHILTGSLGRDDSGNISIQSNGEVRVGNSTLQTQSMGLGKGGEISIRAENVIIGGTLGTFLITASIPASAESLGLEKIQQLQQLGFLGSGGDAGRILIHAINSISINNSAILSSSDTSGDSGGIFVHAGDSISLRRTVLTTSTLSQNADAGRAGDIGIRTNQLRVQNGAIDAESNGVGRSGTLFINAPDSVQLVGAALGPSASNLETLGSTQLAIRDFGVSSGGLSVQSTAGGNAGNLEVQTARLTIRDGAKITVTSTGTGQAGNLDIRSRLVSLTGGARINAQNEVSSSGGNITIQGLAFQQPLQSLQVTNSLISASTERGRAGSIAINAPGGTVRLNGTLPSDHQRRGGLSVAANQIGGFAGDLAVNTRNLIVENGARISASNQSVQPTNGQPSGNITLTGLDNLQVLNGLITASTRTGRAGNITVNAQGGEVGLSGTLPDRRQGGLSVRATGNGGNAGELSIITRQLAVEDGAQISGSVTTGRAGDVSISATDSVRLRGDGSNLAVEATGRRGAAGSLTVNTNQLTVDNEATASVSSPQGRAGNLEISANSVFLDSGDLTAVAGEGGGANINLRDLDLLVMRNSSQVSADARNAASGGNVNINPNGNGYGFLVAVPGEDSDIVARAVEGRGGEIVINSEGVFGIEQRSPSANNGTNDIDASSQRGPQGVVTINRPDTDPSRGLTELPTDVIDAANQINQVCPTGTTATRDHGSFVITGRGGLPPNPIDALNGDGLQTGWAALDSAESTTSTSVTSETIPEATSQTQLVEAQSWVKGANGEVIFLPQSSQSAPQSRSSASNRCQ